MKKKSIYTFLFRHNEECYLFNTETFVKAKISSTLFDNLSENNLSEIDNDLLNFLEKKKIIVEEKNQYDFFHKMEIETNRINYDMTNMTLFLIPTIDCNFCCPYCFEGVKKNRSMNLTTVQNIINFLNNSSAQKLSIHWYGGEPLLRFDLMKTIYKYIKNKTSLKIIGHNIVTNGYLVNHDTVDFFKATKINKIQITLDGKKETHDKKRHIKGSKDGSFNKIINNIKLLSEQLPKTHIHIRVNIDKSNYKEFVSLYHFIHESCDSSNNIYVYPAMIKIYNSLSMKLNEQCFNNNELFNLYEYYQRNGCKVVFFPKEHKHTCSVCNMNTYTIGPDGELYKCPEDANKLERIIGNINVGSIENESLLLKYINDSSQFKRQECKDCLCFPICYGGCGKEYLKDKYFHAKLNYCHPFKNTEVLKRAILDDSENREINIEPNLQFRIY